MALFVGGLFVLWFNPVYLPHLNSNDFIFAFECLFSFTPLLVVAPRRFFILSQFFFFFNHFLFTLFSSLRPHITPASHESDLPVFVWSSHSVLYSDLISRFVVLGCGWWSVRNFPHGASRAMCCSATPCLKEEKIKPTRCLWLTTAFFSRSAHNGCLSTAWRAWSGYVAQDAPPHHRTLVPLFSNPSRFSHGRSPDLLQLQLHWSGICLWDASGVKWGMPRYTTAELDSTGDYFACFVWCSRIARL